MKSGIKKINQLKQSKDYFNFKVYICALFIIVGLLASTTFAFAQAKTAAQEISYSLMTYNYAEAVNAAEHNYKKSGSVDGALLYAETLNSTGNFKETEKIYEEALGKYPDSISIYNDYAKFALSRINFARAAELYNKGFEKIIAENKMFLEQKKEAAVFFGALQNYYKKFNMQSAEIEFHEKMALNFARYDSEILKKSINYLLETKQYARSEKLIEKLKNIKEIKKSCIADSEIDICLKMLGDQVNTETCVKKLDELYTLEISNPATNFDRMIVLVTAYYDFLSSNGLFQAKTRELTEKASQNKATPEELFILTGLSIQKPNELPYKKYLKQYVQVEKTLKSRMAAAKLLRRFGEYFASMSELIDSFSAAGTDEQKAELYYELASNFSNLYYIDQRYMIFKNAAFKIFEEGCKDFTSNLIFGLNSKRFMRGKFDAMRIALRQLISRKNAIYYYNELIEKYPAFPNRAAALTELGGLYGSLGLADDELKTYKKFLGEYTDSVYLAGALRKITNYYIEGRGKSASAVENLENAMKFITQYIEGDFKKLEKASGAMEAIYNASNNNYEAEYIKKTYDFFYELNRKFPNNPYVTDKYISMIGRVEMPFNKKIEAIDGILKIGPYNLSVLKVKENIIQNEVANKKYANMPSDAPLILEKFYEDNYFVTNSFFDKYLETISKNSKIGEKIDKLEKEINESSLKPLKLKLLAECYFFVSNFEKAETLFDKYCKIVSADVSALNKLAGLKKSFAKTDEAVKIYDKIIEITPWDKNAYISAGDLLAQSKNFEAGNDYFKKIIEIDPENNDNYLDLATIYWDYYKYQAGLELLKTRREKTSDNFIFGRELASFYELEASAEVAIPEYISVICGSDDNKNADVSRYVDYSGANENDGRNDNDEQRYSRNNWRYNRPEKPEATESRARLFELYGRDKFKNMIDNSFQTAIKQFPENFKIYHEYIKLLTDHNLTEKALEYVNTAAQKFKKSDEISNLAQACENLSELALAKNLYLKAIELNPKDRSNYDTAIEFMKKHNMTGDNLKVMKLRAENFSEETYYLDEYAKALMVCNSASTAANLKEAALIYEGLIKKAPARKFYYSQTADIKSRLEGTDSALNYIDACIKNISQNRKYEDLKVSLQENKIRFLIKTSKIDEALKLYEELIYANPREATFASSLGELAASKARNTKIKDFIFALDETRLKPINKALICARFSLKTADYENAIANYKKAYDIDPKNADILFEFLKAARKKHDYQLCKTLIAKYIEILKAAKDSRIDEAYKFCVQLTVDNNDIDYAKSLIMNNLKEIADNFVPPEQSSYSSQYITSADNFSKILINSGVYDIALEVLNLKIEHYNKFLLNSDSERNRNINEIKYEIADVYYKQGEYQKSADILAELIEGSLNSGEAVYILPERMKKIIYLWRRTGAYEKNIKDYEQTAKSNESNSYSTAKFLFEIYKTEDNSAACVELTKELLSCGKYIDFMVNFSIDTLRKVENYDGLLYLLEKRVINSESRKIGSAIAGITNDLIECGVIAERKKMPKAADAYFEMALKNSSSNETIRKVADSLFYARLYDKSLKYYDSVLGKYSNPAYYLCAPDIGLKFAEAGFGKYACEIAENILKKYPNDIKISLNAAKIFLAAGAKKEAAELLSNIIESSTKVSELAPAVLDYSKCSDSAVYLNILNTLAQKIKKENKGKIPKDYEFIYSEKAGTMIENYQHSSEIELKETAAEFLNGGFTASQKIAFTEKIIDGFKQESLKTTEISYKAEYLKYVEMLSDNLSGKDNKTEKVISIDDLQKLTDLIFNLAPPEISFAGNILPLMKKLSALATKPGPEIIIKLAGSKVSYEKKKAGELLEFYKQFCDVTAENSAYLAGCLYESANYEESLKFAENAISLDDENFDARLIKLNCLCAMNDIETAGKSADEFNIYKAFFHNNYYKTDEPEYYDNNYFSNIKLEALKSLIKIGRPDSVLEISRKMLELARSNFYYDGAYYASKDYNEPLLAIFGAAGTQGKSIKELESSLDMYMLYSSDNKQLTESIKKYAVTYANLYNTFKVQELTAEVKLEGKNKDLKKAVKNAKANVKTGEIKETVKSSDELYSAARAYADILKKFSANDYNNAETALEKYLKIYPSNLFLIELVFGYADYIENQELIKLACDLKCAMIPELAPQMAEYYHIWQSKNAFNGRIEKETDLNGGSNNNNDSNDNNGGEQ